jgi:NAD-dependent SIR2 family protein deacetylase
MNGSVEKPTPPITVHVEGLLSKEIDSEPVAFVWPHITEDSRRMDGICLGEDAKDIYAVTLYQESLPDSIPENVRKEMKTANYDGIDFFYAEAGKRPENYDISHACEYLVNTSQTTGNMRQEHYEKIALSEATETKRIDLDEFEELISQGNVLFYTGAGISIEAGLPSGSAVINELGVQMNRDFDTFTESLILREEQLQEKLCEYQRLFYGSTTQAHEALEKLRAANPDRIVLATENLDKLHQNADSPIITFEQISKVPKEFLQDVDCVVTVGLQQACTDLLRRYKEENENGKLIALNKNPPPYQYPADYYLEGDAQDILVRVVE